MSRRRTPEAKENKETGIRIASAMRSWSFFSCLILAGCGPDGPGPIQLTLISPHRDEIREEVAQAFKTWFHARSQERAAVAPKALAEWLAEPTPERFVTAENSLAECFADWRVPDLGGLAKQWQSWKAAATAERGRALLDGLDRWRESFRPIDLVWIDVGGGTSQIERYIRARFEANPDGIDIDLLFGGGTDIYLRFAGQDRLERLALPTALVKRIRPELNGVPLYDPRGRWYGPMLSSFGILYNREVLQRIGQPEPRAWADLGKPGLYGWISSGEPRMTGSIHMVYEVILQGLGWEKGFRLLLRMGANTHSFIRDSGTLTRTVVNGEVAAAGNLDANALTAVGRNPVMLAYHLPEGETIINPDAVAVLRGAPHKELARAFVEFTLSDAGQLLWMLRPGQPGGPRRFPLCRLSVVEELYQRYPAELRSVGAANPFEIKNTISYDSRLGATRWDALNDLFGAVIVDAQPELAEAWRATLRNNLPDQERSRLEAALFNPPVSAQELLEHARRIVADGPRYRTVTVNRWGEQARRRYRHIREQAAGERGVLTP